MTVGNIFDYLNSLFPVYTACDFDNAGLLIGDENAEVKKVLVALDCTFDTFKVALEKGCNLIITHHPVIFSPLKNILKGSLPFELLENGIAVISMHTNLDIGDGGVNECLCRAIGLKNISAFAAEDGFILRSGATSPVSAERFAEEIKATLGGCVKFVDGGKEIKTVLVCSGSGGDFLETAIKGGFDAFVSSEIKHHQFLAAAECGISVFDAGHFNTEDIVIEPLCDLLKNNFKNIEFLTCHKTSIKCKQCFFSDKKE